MVIGKKGIHMILSNKLKSNKGFTLAEVMVALSIILTITGIYMTLYFSGNTANMKSREKLDALIKGQNVIEQLKVADTITEGTNTITDGDTITEIITLESSKDDIGLYRIQLVINTHNAGVVRLSTKLCKAIGAE
jgi:prepilin-type N-terminal cleavage/methylation domain-containing protein